MSLSLDTVLQVVDVVQRAIAIYRKVRDGPEQLAKIGRRMERLNDLLVNLEHHLRSRSAFALARLRKTQTEALLAIIEATRVDCQKEYDLFDKWENNIGPWGVQFRFTTFAQAYFTLGTSSDKLEALSRDIEDHRKDIDIYMGLMGVQGIQDNHIGIEKLRQDNAAMKKQLEAIHEMLQAKGGPALSPVATQKGEGVSGNKPSVSPSPAPRKLDYRVIFVDTFNVGRSVIAASLMDLLKGWTLQTRGDWRIQQTHSAGFFVKKQCSCVGEIETLDFSQKTYKKLMAWGGTPAKKVAVAALLDNKSYDYPFKKTVREALAARRSRGLSRNVFKDYDFIIVLTSREHDNMVALKKALVAKDGKDAAPRGKGRVLHLGRYLAQDNIPTEIYDPSPNEDGSDSRENWNRKVSQLKTAIKAFLREEMSWSQPSNRPVLNE